ncbi:MAG: trypsin-like peptidase domain-containing protein [Gemmatimonadetes bacterium]|nr:trypsin-like peptidase domain-containing protein [Gemmatimonadota bacterium]
MSVALAVRSGALAGRTFSFDRAMFSVGRHPDCDLVFDAHKDIDVSGRHAEFVTIGPRTVVRDLGSTNGTWLNGVRLGGDAEVYSGDTVGFGERGPQVVVTVEGGAPRPAASPAARVSSGARVPDTGPAAPPVAPVASATPPGMPIGRGTQMKINAAVEQTTRKMQVMLLMVAVVLGAAGIGAYLYGKRQGDEKIKQLMASNDSVLRSYTAALEAAKGKAGGLDTVLTRYQAEMRRMQAQIAAGGSREDVERLQRELDEARRGGARVLSAAQMDLEAIYARNGKAVALIIVEMPNGEKSAATAFSIDAKGVLVTNRHAVKDPGTGAVAKRIAVLFNDTQGWQPAHVVRVNDGDDDLAVLQLDRAGPFPAVVGVAPVADAPRSGQSVAIIGYPLGVDLGVEGGLRGTARASINPGTVSKTIERLTQIDAYAAQGSSGSPVFDNRGLVIGVVYGGPTEAQGRIVYAVPLAKLIGELAR